MFKKIFSLIFAVVFSFLMIGTVSASDISTYDLGGQTKTSTIIITGNKATCQSIYRISSDDCASITVVQTLEKHSWWFFWDTVGDSSTKTVYSTGSLSLTNYKYNLSSGTYRVKSVFTVKLKDGRSETVTVYSSEKTI